jgi:hypothetical protein
MSILAPQAIISGFISAGQAYQAGFSIGVSGFSSSRGEYRVREGARARPEEASSGSKG